ncbi:MAG: hypothetical protein M0006_17295 [Magnetospirillum sp.]|nr:hypothetical protein [Magnetospirillum sp.]
MSRATRQRKAAITTRQSKQQTSLSLRTVLGLVAAVVIGAGALSWWTHASTNSGDNSVAVPEGTLQVQQLAADMLDYKGTIDLRGVVARAGMSIAGGTGFVLVDSREARLCKSTGCAAFYLPVKWTGELPKQWDELHLRGSVMMGDKYPFFQVESLDKLGTIS